MHKITSGTTQRSQRGLRMAPPGVKKHFKRAAVHPRLLKRNTFFGAWRQRPSQHVFWCIDHGPVQQLWSQAASQDETEKIRKVSKSTKQRPCTLTKSRTWFDSSVCINVYLRRGDESQPLARIFLFPHRNVVVAAMIEVITPNVLFQSRVNRSPNHLQHLWKTSPCFATLHPPFLSITSHPLANYLVPNRNGRCSPLSFGVPPFSSVFPLLLMIFLHILSFFSNFFPAVPSLSSVFLLRNLP